MMRVRVGFVDLSEDCGFVADDPFRPRPRLVGASQDKRCRFQGAKQPLIRSICYLLFPATGLGEGWCWTNAKDDGACFIAVSTGAVATVRRTCAKAHNYAFRGARFWCSISHSGSAFYHLKPQEMLIGPHNFVAQTVSVGIGRCRCLTALITA